MPIQPTDSLMIADTVMRGAGDMFAPVDSLFASDTLPHMADSLVGSAPVTAEAVYGAASTLALPPDGAAQAMAENAAPLTGNIFYDLATLACFVSLCMIVYLYRGYAFGIFNVLRGGATTEKILGEQSKVFGAFLTTVISLGLFITGLCILKFVDLFAVSHPNGLSGWMALLPIVVACGTVALIWGYQFVALRTVGSLTSSQEFVGRLFFLKKIVAAIGTIVILPLFLLFALSDGKSALVLAVLIAGIAGLVTIFLIVRTFMLFLLHNFPISLWILYFCAVEIFPVSFVAIIAMRTMG